jgi:hypothetical protein
MDEAAILTNEEIEEIVNPETHEIVNPSCVRNASNVTVLRPQYIFDKIVDNRYLFDPVLLNEKIKTVSPKLNKLLEKIADLDEHDLETDGRLYKHFIFSELKSGYGTKIIVSALIASGWTLGYSPANMETIESARHGKFAPIELLDKRELHKTKSRNFYFLSSVDVFGKPLSVKMKKQILANFNERPDNVYGENARIIVMDSGFKEGIDLFDIKYIHIFEPTLSIGDQRQVIGRGTRFCGQKGLEFHPTRGWPLYVHIYDFKIDENFNKRLLDSMSGIEYYMKSRNINFMLATLTSEMERLLIYGSVDYELTRRVHGANLVGGAGARRRIIVSAPPVLEGAADAAAATAAATSATEQKIDFDYMRKYVRENFAADYTWPELKMENLCGGPTARRQRGGAATYMNLTQTQGFIQKYFTPQLPIKGMLLNHSVGTGKTCTAIATATRAFEDQGYTILWVTRTTLKNDIWKNMFDQVCNYQFQMRHAQMPDQFDIPADPKARMKLLSKSWAIRPISYKQFSNLVSKKNAYYKKLEKLNGADDPLRKTLLIIDEAHKLFGGGDLSSIERPDTNALHAALMNSYLVSGADSVRLLLMTATPMIDSPMEVVQLLNLCKMPAEQIESNIESFAKIYLDETGRFTDHGQEKFLDQIAGHVSYLNRERDARQFSQPTIKHVEIPLVDAETEDAIKMFDRKAVRDYHSNIINKYKQELLAEREKWDSSSWNATGKHFAHLKEKCDKFPKGKQKTACNKVVRENIRNLTLKIKDYVKSMRDKIKSLSGTVKESRALSTADIKKINANIVENAEEYKTYMESPYYHLSTKCKKRITTKAAMNKYIKNHSAILNLEGELEAIDQEKKKTILENKLRVKNIKMNFSELKRTSKKSGADVSGIDEEMKKAVKNIGAENRRTIKKIADMKKSIEKSKKKVETGLKKTLKKRLRADAKEQTKAARAERKIKKKLGELKHEDYNNIVGEYENKIDEDLEKLGADFEESEAAAAAAKVAKVEAREAARAAKKEAAASARVAKKEAAEAARAAKKEAAAAERAAKKEAAAAAKTKKAAEKAAAKAAAAAARATKKSAAVRR